MRIPKLNPLKERRQITSAFLGYDKRAVIEDGAWRNTQNVTLDEYPTLKVRGKRGTILDDGTAVAPTEIVKCGNKLAYIEGSVIHVGDESFDWSGSITANSEHQLIVFGAYLLIFPEQRYINTTDFTDRGDMDAGVYTDQYPVFFRICDKDGEAIGAQEGTSPPGVADEGDWWLDTSTIPNVLRKYNGEEWIAYGSTYISVTCSALGTTFKVGDGVEIGTYTTTTASDPAELPKGIEGYHTITAVTNGNIVFKGELDKKVVISTTPGNPDPISGSRIFIGRWMPKLDVVFECGNRLWGAFCGSDSGEFYNEIYATALGDFKNWRVYGTISTNSYTASVGHGGKFTGGCNYQGIPTFFKEDMMFRVYGSYPEQYQIQQTPCIGPMDEFSAGQHSKIGRSLAIVNNILYYKSRGGVCYFDGSAPVDIGGIFGDTKYHDAVGGAFGKKYYLSMADEDNVYHLFVYDTSKGQWIREDNTRVRRFAEVGDECYFIWYDGTNRKLMTVNGTGEKESGPIEWYAETGDLGLTYQSGRYTYQDVDRKYVERLTIRMRLGIGSYVAVEISYNGGEFKTISRIAGYNLESFSLPVPVKRCDHFRLRLSGRGDAQIYSIAKLVQGGSDI